MKMNGRTHTINSCKHIQNRLRKGLQALLRTSNDTHSAREEEINIMLELKWRDVHRF